MAKKLWSSANQGELVKLNCYMTGKDEAQGVSDIIENKLKKIFFKSSFNSGQSHLPNQRVRREISPGWNWLQSAWWY